MLPARLYNLDFSRGLAALCVVIFHWQSFFFEQYELPATFDRTTQPLYQWLRPLYERGGYLAVSFFFILSGFVFFWLYHQNIRDRQCSFYQFAALRLARLYPLHAATLLLVLALQVVYFSRNNESFVYPYNDGYHFVLQTFFVSNWGFERGYSFNAPIWSVSIEIGLYVLFFAFAFLRGNTAVKLVGIVLTTVLLMGLGLSDRWAPAILAFFMGGLTYECLVKYLQLRSKTLDIIVVSTALALWLGISISDRVAQLLLTQGMHVLVLYPFTIVALVLMELEFPHLGKRFAWIGDITYSSYLLHFPLQLGFVLCATKIGYDKSLFLSPGVRRQLEFRISDN